MQTVGEVVYRKNLILRIDYVANREHDNFMRNYWHKTKIPRNFFDSTTCTNGALEVAFRKLEES